MAVLLAFSWASTNIGRLVVLVSLQLLKHVGDVLCAYFFSFTFKAGGGGVLKRHTHLQRCGCLIATLKELTVEFVGERYIS